MRYTLEIRSNRIYVVCHDTDYYKPETIRAFWPTTYRANMMPLDHESKSVEVKFEGGGYFGAYFRGKHSYVSEYLRLRLANGSDTKADFIEREELPAPKTSVKVRYECGGWQKYLKARGWVDA